MRLNTRYAPAKKTSSHWRDSDLSTNPLQQDESVVDRSTGKSVGVVRVVAVDNDLVEGSGHRGLAVLRLKEAQAVIDGSKKSQRRGIDGK